jgi:hypothetical protein
MMIQPLHALEQLRGSTVLVYFLNHEAPIPKMIESADVPWMYQVLVRASQQQPIRKLDVLLHSQGGVVSTGYRLAKLLRSYCEELSIFVVHKAHSAATLLCLGADQLVMTPLSELSPIDPHLSAQVSVQGEPTLISNEDIYAYQAVAQDFGLTSSEERALTFRLLAERVFPPTLGTFHRSRKHMEKLSRDLLNYWCQDPKRRDTIAQQLISGYFSHDYPIDAAEAKSLGLPVRVATQQEEVLMLEVWQHWNKSLSPEICGLMACQTVKGIYRLVETSTSEQKMQGFLNFEGRWSLES